MSLAPGWTALACIGLWLLPACAARPVEEAPPEKPAPVAAKDDVIDRAADELALRRQFSRVMSERLYALARRQRDAGEYAPALETVHSALRYEPTSEKAARLRDELLLLLGDRAGEARTLLEDHWQAHQARQEARRIAAQVWIRRAEEATARGDLEGAKRAYENARFIVEASK